MTSYLIQSKPAKLFPYQFWIMQKDSDSYLHPIYNGIHWENSCSVPVELNGTKSNMICPRYHVIQIIHVKN